MQSQAVHMMILFLLLLSIDICTAQVVPGMAKYGCQEHCGDVLIPYPFGIGHTGCYLDDWFEIECNQSSKTTSSAPDYKPFLKRAQLEVLNISIGGTLQVNSPVTFFCNGNGSSEMANLTGSPFVYSQDKNRFTAVSCGFLAVMESAEFVVGGCRSVCDNQNSNSCDIGINCCQTTIPPCLTMMGASILYQGETRKADCDDYAFLVDKDWFESEISSSAHEIKNGSKVPVVLQWNIINSTSSFALFGRYVRNKYSFINVDDYERGIPYCFSIKSLDASKLSCSCPDGFEGNPYLLQTCQDIDECMIRHTRCGAHSKCVNVPGYYVCVDKKNTRFILVIGLGAGLGLLLLLIGAWLGYRFLKKRHTMKRREMFFKRNGGLLLEKQLSSGEVNVEKIKLFKSKELEKSTDNFNIDRILGQGGQGTVYKGMLTDGRIVAVKKSKIVDESQLSDFINEVVILSQINHRNMVQLLGCCLETEVPILVYEFIPNGNLSQYIHEQNEEFPLTWEVRLRIAMEIAGALSYLHASAAFPIYHRDIKSTNILLDAKYRAKVADFGTSRSVAIDQTHLTTLVHGTFGYLDPEYFQSSQFTEKSDVYSFGVVLVELLTGQKPISFRRSQEEGKSLATYFITSMQLDRLFEILDAEVVKGGSKADIILVANLARRCLNLSGRKRPTMREVTAELEGIQMSEKTSNGGQNYEEVEFVRTDSIEPWDVASSSTGTRPSLDGGPSSSLHEIPLLPYKSW
ncbi:wall-associated receptor kinase-like 3 [Prunus avium]|uniref:Wall-associated receptor kinase-like 3 n=1 Tax=Prunus avium TaxID=42229 RepID=A0A6P5RIM9_PRUAV|nr:wall-associated receptor kinase-like 3 [Prunus avium]